MGPRGLRTNIPLATRFIDDRVEQSRAWPRKSPIQRVQIQESFLGRDKQKLRYRALRLRRNLPIAALDRARRRPLDSSTYAMGE